MIRERAIAIGCIAALTCFASAARAEVRCTMDFSLRGWSAFYKTATGSGRITCDNGQAAMVHIQATGGGLTVGKSKVTNGHGAFSPVEGVSELYGNYAQAEAHAGMGESKTAQVLTKGTVSLELTGSGQGIDLGFSFGKFTISKAK
jgi:hypothetical protein